MKRSIALAAVAAGFIAIPLTAALADMSRHGGHGDRAERAAARFAEFDAGVRGWVNHVRYADTWGLRRHVLGQPLPLGRP